MVNNLQAGLELLLLGLATVFTVLVLLMLLIKGIELAVKTAGSPRPAGKDDWEKAAVTAAVMAVVLAENKTVVRLRIREIQEEK